jgi:hypothetical protein
MFNSNLIGNAKNKYSQNGEDGIIEKFFEEIPAVSRSCCEFGAWDGLNLSNCRKLIEEGWSAVMIEGDSGRYKALVENYRSNSEVKCVNRFVDAGANSLKSILNEFGVDSLDFLSVDIDGLDYEIFESLDLRPAVTCIEVNAGHDPLSRVRIPAEISAHNVGQPLGLFYDLAKKHGYDLVCYNGNAFFVRSDLRKGSNIPALEPSDAYSQFLNWLPSNGRQYLYLVNLGVVFPFHQFNNTNLSRVALGLGKATSILLVIRWGARSLASKCLSLIRKVLGMHS